MNYDEFRSAICDSLRDAFPDNTDFRSRTILKNNDHQKDAIMISIPGAHFSPTIYPENYYPMYETGHSIEYITSRIMEGCLGGYDLSLPSPDTLYDKDYIRSRITFRLVSASMNRQRLADIPYIPFNDLAIVFYCLLDTDDEALTGFMIHDTHASFWKMTADDLYALALENTPRLLPMETSSIREVLMKHMDSRQDIADIIDYTPDFDMPMYVMTNTSHVFGAGSMLYPGALSSFAKKEGTDLIIMPSSVHEIIMIPADESLSTDFLNDIIASGNSTITDPEELLGDHYYYYSLSRDEVTMPK